MGNTLKQLIEAYIDQVSSFVLTEKDLEDLKSLEKFYGGTLDRIPKVGDHVKYGKFGYLLFPSGDKAPIIKINGVWDIGYTKKELSKRLK